ncbi:hypothetical protein VTN77DRAFT_3173 [Rasamsonia byssochlamydoides]|uniref:uncharacterized protein n=1 Tax=Rasamsonia byssochlamydoides TaxID=89139 RepID=UPI003743B0B7
MSVDAFGTCFSDNNNKDDDDDHHHHHSDPSSTLQRHPSLPTNSATRVEAKRTLSAGEKLLRSLSNAFLQLWAIRNNNIVDIIGRKRLPARDRRIDDITRVEGDPNASIEDRLLRTSAWISYASRFTEYQQLDGDRVRVDYLVELLLAEDVDPRSFHEGQGGTIAKYVRKSGQFIGRERFVSLAIGHGIRYLVIKKLLEEKLMRQKLEPEWSCHSSGIRIGTR